MIHGKVHTYNKGCRCDECKAAKARAKKKSIARSKLPKVKIYSYFEEGFNILVYLIHSTIENTMADIQENVTGLGDKKLRLLLIDLEKSGFIDFKNGFYLATDKARGFIQ